MGRLAQGARTAVKRGDPDRGHAFFVYPRKLRLVNRRWDTHAHPRDYCANYRVVKRLGNGVFECKCLDTPSSWGPAWLLTAIGSATAVAVTGGGLKLLADGQRRVQAWRFTKTTAMACGVGATSVAPSVWLAVVGAQVYSAAYVTSAFADGFFKGNQAALRVSALIELWPPLAAYSALLLSAPLIALQCGAFRLLSWWGTAMTGTGGVAAAGAVLYIIHTNEQQRNLERTLEAMVGPASGA